MENPKLDLPMGKYSNNSTILSLVKSFSQTFKLPFSNAINKSTSFSFPYPTLGGVSTKCLLL